MGGFYGSVQVRTEDRDRVRAVADQVAREMNIRVLVGPKFNGWVGIYPENYGQGVNVARNVAQQLDGYVLHLLAHDEDVFSYWLYHNGQLVDAFCSAPGYIREESRAREEQMAGNPEAFRPIVGQKVNRLAKLLDRAQPESALASEYLEAFAKVLGISNAVQAYEYLKERDSTGVKGRRRFEELPAELVAADVEKKRAARNYAKTARQELKSKGMLLSFDVRKETTPLGCRFDDGFLVAWGDYPNRKVSFTVCRPPWSKARSFDLPAVSCVTSVAADRQGRRVVMAVGDRLQVYDVAAGGLTYMIDVPDNEGVGGAAISDDGRLTLHTTRRELIVTDVAVNRRLCAVPWTDTCLHSAAFHPSGEWLAVGGKNLCLIHIGEPPQCRNLCIGPDPRVVAGHYERMRQEMQNVDFALVEETQRATIQPTLEALLRAKVISQDVLEAERRKLERTIEKSLADLAAVQAGTYLPAPPEPEFVNCVGFSHDGRWLWCGTRVLRVYEWDAVLRTETASLPAPIWTFEFPRVVCPTEISAVAEEPDGAGLAFGGQRCSLFRGDLSSGETRELIRLPVNSTVGSLVLSSDGSSLAASTRTVSLESRSTEPSNSWDVWSYPQLRDSSL